MMDQVRYGSSLSQVNFKRKPDRRAGSEVTQGSKEFHVDTHGRLMGTEEWWDVTEVRQSQ